MLARLFRLVRTGSAKPSALAFFAVLFLVSQVSMMVVLAPVGVAHFIEMQTTLSPARFAALVADMYGRGVETAYIAHFYYDWLHPVWYGGLLALLLARGFERQAVPASRDRLLLAPVAAGLADLLENSLHLYMVVDTANISPALVLAANGAALFKWAVITACVTGALVMLVRPAVVGGRS